MVGLLSLPANHIPCPPLLGAENKINHKIMNKPKWTCPACRARCCGDKQDKINHLIDDLAEAMDKQDQYSEQELNAKLALIKLN